MRRHSWFASGIVAVAIGLGSSIVLAEEGPERSTTTEADARARAALEKVDAASQKARDHAERAGGSAARGRNAERSQSSE